jgi:hypothetical protein
MSPLSGSAADAVNVISSSQSWIAVDAIIAMKASMGKFQLKLTQTVNLEAVPSQVSPGESA